MSGPSPNASPPVAPQKPSARERAFGSLKALAMMESATGLSMEPPNPWIARNTIRLRMSVAALHSTDPSVNKTSPV